MEGPQTVYGVTSFSCCTLADFGLAYPFTPTELPIKGVKLEGTPWCAHLPVLSCLTRDWAWDVICISGEPEESFKH